MTIITLQLSPELKRKLQESIARRDAQSIRQLLAEAFAPTVEAFLKQTPTQLNDKQCEDEQKLEESIDRLLDEFASHVNSIPTLSDYAVSREGIYEEHS
jgi:hypothetical protein